METNSKIGTLDQSYVEQWGKDHWSLLAYCETREVDHRGILDLKHMRICSPKRKFGNGNLDHNWREEWGTRLRSFTIPDGKHDDIDVLDELETAGFLKNLGTDINPRIKLTDVGRVVNNKLREFKAAGGTFNTFSLY